MTSTAKSEHLNIAVLQAMYRQVSDINDTIGKTRPPNMSLQMYDKTLRDIQAQMDALNFAIMHLIRAFGEPPTEHLRAEQIDMVSGKTYKLQ